MTDEEKPIVKQGPPQFIPKLIGKKVTMRLVSGNQPITGTIKTHNPYEILLQTAKGEIIEDSEKPHLIDIFK